MIFALMPLSESAFPGAYDEWRNLYFMMSNVSFGAALTASFELIGYKGRAAEDWTCERRHLLKVADVLEGRMSRFLADLQALREADNSQQASKWEAVTAFMRSYRGLAKHCHSAIYGSSVIFNDQIYDNLGELLQVEAELEREYDLAERYYRRLSEQQGEFSQQCAYILAVGEKCALCITRHNTYMRQLEKLGDWREALKLSKPKEQRTCRTRLLHCAVEYAKGAATS